MPCLLTQFYIVQKILTYPLCTGGQRACPLEDCGGIPGFYNLEEAISDPNHDDHEEMLG